MNESTRFENEMELLSGSDAGSESFSASVAELTDYETPQEAACRKEWDQIVAKLAAPVKQALADEKYGEAVSLAIIHHGLRDKHKLASMIYKARYGTTRGYCRIKAGDHDAIGKYNDVLVNIVEPRIDIPARPLPQEGGVDCTAHQRFEDKSRPDTPITDLTGRYEARVGVQGAGSIYAALINQAGTHIEVAIVPFFGPNNKEKDRPVTRFFGDQQKDGSFTLFSRENPSQFGTIRRDPSSGKVILKSTNVQNDRLGLPVRGTAEQVLTPIVQRTTLSEAAFNPAYTPGHLAERFERFPLQHTQVKWIMRALEPDRIEPFLVKYFAVPADDRVAGRIALRKAADPLASYMYKILSHPVFGIHPSDYPLAQYYAQVALAAGRWKHKNIIRSHLDWIQIMTSVVTHNEGEQWLASIQRLTGARPWNKRDPKVDQAPYQYKVTLKLSGGAFFVQGYLGKLTVEQIKPGPWPEGKQTYNVRMVGFGVKAGVEFGHEMTGIGSSYVQWQPPDFPGDIHLVKGQIDVHVASAEGGFMHIYGSETMPMMQVTFDKVDLKASGLTKKPKIDNLMRAIDLSGSWGSVRSKSFSRVDYSTARVKSDYSVAYALTRKVHFCLDSALLLPPARHALRILCANELAAFESPTSHLTVYAHTDRSDNDARNLELSNMRARNTYLAIRDILGKKYALPADHLIIEGKGEMEAIKDGRPDKEINPKYRRVDVILNGRLVLSLNTQ